MKTNIIFRGENQLRKETFDIPKDFLDCLGKMLKNPIKIYISNKVPVFKVPEEHEIPKIGTEPKRALIRETGEGPEISITYGPKEEDLDALAGSYKSVE